MAKEVKYYPRLDTPKQCRGCRATKDTLEYHTNSRARDGRALYCKSCQAKRDGSPNIRFNHMRADSKRYGVECTLSLDEYADLLAQPCHYCGEPVQDRAGKGLDRLDRAKGYIPGNVVRCCWLCNHVKGTTFDREEMCEVAKLFKGFKERRAQLGLPVLDGPRTGGPNGGPKTPRYWLTEDRRKHREKMGKK